MPPKPDLIATIEAKLPFAQNATLKTIAQMLHATAPGRKARAAKTPTPHEPHEPHETTPAPPRKVTFGGAGLGA
jgi:hypothetical protein